MSIENTTIEQLQFHQVGHTISCGEHKYHGRIIKDSRFIIEYVTSVGRFLPEEWIETAKKVVIYHGLTDLYEKIKQHCRMQCIWLKTEKQIEEHALSCMASHAYEYWEDFSDKNNEGHAGDLPQAVQMELSDFIEVSK